MTEESTEKSVLEYEVRGYDTTYFYRCTSIELTQAYTEPMRVWDICGTVILQRVGLIVACSDPKLKQAMFASSEVRLSADQHAFYRVPFAAYLDAWGLRKEKAEVHPIDDIEVFSYSLPMRVDETLVQGMGPYIEIAHKPDVERSLIALERNALISRYRKSGNRRLDPSFVHIGVRLIGENRREFL
jgi:hypothetical protein